MLRNIQSFDALEYKIQKVIEQGAIKKPKSFPVFILGNKIDKEDKREVDQQTVSKFMKEHPQMKHFLISAKSREGVDVVFQKIALAAFLNK